MKTRLEELDVIRGYAIFGILVCNIVLFNYPLEYTGPYFAGHTAWYDQLATYVRFNFFGDKTFTLFSLLFGVGIGMQYVKRERVGEPFTPYHITRMFLLLIMGLFHMLLIWYGDILGLYALLGGVALFFIRLPFRYLLGLSALFFVWPTIQTILTRNGFMQIASGMAEIQPLDELVSLNTSQGISGHLTYNLSQVPGTIEFYLSGTLYYSMSMILAGIAFARCEVHKMIREHLNFYKTTLIFTTVLVLLWNGYQLFFFDPNQMGTASNFYTYWFFFQLSVLGQTFFVVSLLVLLLNSRFGGLKKAITPLRHLGRLSLSNYLLHSVLGLVAFKLLGFYGRSAPGMDMLMVICFTILQIMLSRWWIKKYRTGPMERVWRWGAGTLVKRSHPTTSQPKKMAG